jgi:hypothetical protein
MGGLPGGNTMGEIELFQFTGSHFNEKARWGLDLKRVPHSRISLMPCLSLAEWGGPEDVPTEKNRAWVARWVDHPGAEWVREIYRRHRRN